MDYRIEDQRLFLDGEPVSFFSGSCQYWRTAPEDWEDILRKVKGMGLDIIETYIPWSVHEVAPGRFDFGQTDRRRDLPLFLETCACEDVKVLARPGPHINAELTYFGYPERIFSREEILARSADGSPVFLPVPPRMFPVPCYHHPRFLAEVRQYMEALAGAVGDPIHPDGPVIAVQVDNECSKFFRTHPFDHDYSEYSIRLYRRFLAGKYADVEDLNRAYRTRYGSWDLVDPPKWFRPSSLEELSRLLDWIEFGEYYIEQSLRKIAGIIRDCFGDGFPLFHNYPTTMPLPPLDLAGSEEFLDFQGVDAYPTRAQYHMLRKGIKYTSTMSRLPALMEFSSGSVYNVPMISLEDQAFTTWAAVMHGIKGINFYMAVERERWYGSPIRRDGSIRERQYEFYQRFLTQLRSLRVEGMECHRPVLVLLGREYERLASAATLLCPVSNLLAEYIGGGEKPADMLIGEEEFGLSEPVPARYSRLQAFWYWVLTAIGAHFAVGDSAHAERVLAGFDLVIMPTFEFLDRGTQEMLVEYVRKGGTLVLGPRVPSLDGGMIPCDILADRLGVNGHFRREPGVFGQLVEELCVLEDDSVSGATSESPLHRENVGEGSLIYLGIVPRILSSVVDAEPFLPLADTLLRNAGIDPCCVPEDRRVDVSLFKSGEREVLFIANPTSDRIETTLMHAGGRVFLDTRTGTPAGGNGSIEVSLDPYAIVVMEAV